MINTIKTIVRNYLNTIKLAEITIGTVVSGGIKVSDKLTVPMELISGNMKKYISSGDIVKLIKNLGGQEYYIVEIISKEFITKGSTVKLNLDGVTRSYKVEDVIE